MTKRINIALSIILAFAGWVYVIYQVDPTTTRSYKDVPVVFTNEDELETKGIALKSIDTSSIEVSVSAKRSILNELNSEDIEAVVDLSDAGEGENTLTLRLDTPSGVTVLDQSAETVTVNTEQITTRVVSSRTEFNTENDSTEPYVISQNVEDFEVHGAKSLVDSVAYVRLPVESEKVSDDEKTFSVKPVAIDDKGDILSYVTVSPTKASVTVVTGTLKTVPLTVRVENPDNDDYLRTYEVPTSVTIKGTEETLENVESIESEVVDLSEETESGAVSIECILPEGVQLASTSVDMTMPVKVTKYEKKTFTINTKNIEVENLGKNLEVSFDTDSIDVTVIDTEANIKDLTKDSFTITIDADDLEAGGYSLKASVTTEAELHKVTLDDEYVYVEITEAD